VFVLPWELDHVGGVNQVVINLYREMILGGEIQPIILVNRWSAFRPIETVIDGRCTVYLRLFSPFAGDSAVVGFLKWLFASPVWIFDILRFCRRHRVSAFNFHYPSLSALSIALLRFLRLYRGALVLSFHGADLREVVAFGRIERALWRFVLSVTTAIVACSKALAAEIREFAGAPAQTVHGVPNGLDIGYFLNSVDRTRTLPPSLANRDFILTVATWEWKKGLDILLRAFAQLNPVKNGGPALVLIGRNGGEESSLRLLAAELGVEREVLFLESVPHPQIGLYMERAKVFCLPSRAEPFGIVILEAGAYRLPVVASCAGGIPEILRDGETGLLTEPGDVTALATALRRVVFDKELASGLGDRLYRRVVNDFSWKRAYEQYRRLIT
jgi:glycosyltransferase involved in cell wall biosynthesis